MADSDHFFFSKKYKVAAKIDHDAFYIKYHIGEQRDSSPAGKDLPSINPPLPQKHQRQSQKKVQYKSNNPDHSKQTDQQKYRPKYKAKKTQQTETKVNKLSEEKVQMKEVQVKLQKKIQSQLQEVLPQAIAPHLSQPVTKEEKKALSTKQIVPLKARISEVDDQQGLDLGKQSINTIRDYKSSNRVVRQQTIYNDYQHLGFIEESREDNEGIYFKGQVEFSQQVKWSARIYSNEKDGYLLVEGKQHLNRALHEDQVYFVIKEEKKQYISCQIVAIINRRSRQLVGKIEMTSNEAAFYLKPINRRIAKMTIQNAELEQKWLKSIDTHYFLCEFTSWELDESFPVCKVIDVYGLAGEIDIETNALLQTYGVADTSCTQNQLTSFTQPFQHFFNKGQFVIPEDELKKRRDFRKWNTFVVRDSIYDAAFSIFPQIPRSKGDPNFLKKNIYDINVHILDLAFFVNRSAHLDEFLRKQMTKLNLFHKVIPLVPQPIAKAIAFQLNKQRLTLSICIQVNEDGTILDSIKATTSVIAPQCILSKAQLQKWISTQKLPLQELKTYSCAFKMESEFAAFAKDLKTFFKLMGKARNNRIQRGAFNFEQPNKEFSFDQNGKPTKFQLKAKSQVDLVLQECAIICQTKIAEFMLKGFKEKAILYRHRFPGVKMMERLKLLAAKASYSFEADDNQQIHKAINNILADQKVKQCVKEAIKYQISKLIENSDYFKSEAEDPTRWNNFAFSIPIFTHCAIPTKKYGDILVQKQLVALIEHKQFKVENLKKLLQQINKATLRSRKIRAESEKIVLCHYLRQHPAFTTGVLLQVFEWGLKVCVTKYGFKTIIKFEDIPTLKLIKSDTDQSGRNFVKVQYRSSSLEVQTLFVLKELQQIDVQVRCSKSIPYTYHVSLAMPNPMQPKNKLLIQ